MTIKQFNSLKIGDSVYLKNTYNNEYTGTEVLDIDRYFKKLTVLLGRKPYSYKYISKDRKPCSSFVGVCKNCY